MTIELRMLALSVVLGFVHIAAASHAASRERGYRWSASARDVPVPPLGAVAARLDRALRNFFETFPLFAAVVLASRAAGTDGTLTQWGAQLYFWARVAYLPLYGFGVPLVRSLAWNVAVVGIVLFVVALLRA